MSQPIEIPGRSRSVPRTSEKRKVQAFSDSQVSYKITEITFNDDDDTDTSDRSIRQRHGSRKNVQLSRRKRTSQSFGSTLKVEQSSLRRCSNPEYMNVHEDSEKGEKLLCPSNSITAALLLAHQTLKLSCPLLPINLPPQVPAPLVVEDPPSSDNASDLEEDTVRYNIDPVFLNGSSGNFGSAGARSAPSTPQGIIPSVGLSGEPHSQPCSPSYTATTIPKSPSHVFGKYDKGALKQLSSSAPIMTAQARSPEPPSPKGAKGEKMPAGSSKARQKKFHRHFTQVDDEERVLNYYSCALVGDILLQGHLYITKNYFAFYSNVFGYVTKLLIPIASVMKISKEKTARIIPNAVGVATAEDKHVFGSLLSRDSTYKLMMMVLKAANSVEPVEKLLPVPKDIRPGERELDVSEFSGEEETSSQSGTESPTLRSVQRSHAGIIPTITKMSPKKTVTDALGKLPLKTRNDSTLPGLKDNSPLSAVAKYNVFLLVSTLLLLLLFTSAGILLYRIGRIQTKYSIGIQEFGHEKFEHMLQDSLVAPTNEIYNEILHWQSQLHSKSAGAVHNFLDSNLDQIAKVRKSLEALSTLLMPNNPSGSQAQAPEHRSEVPPETNTNIQVDGTALPDSTAS